MNVKKHNKIPGNIKHTLDFIFFLPPYSEAQSIHLQAICSKIHETTNFNNKIFMSCWRDAISLLIIHT